MKRRRRRRRPVYPFNSRKSKTPRWIYRTRAFSRIYSEPMIYDEVDGTPRTTTPATMTGIYRIKYMNTSERNQSSVYDSRPIFADAQFHSFS